MMPYIWQHRSRYTVVLVMAWWLTAPSHYLNQCWLICIKDVLWHSCAILQEVLMNLVCNMQSSKYVPDCGLRPEKFGLVRHNFLLYCIYTFAKLCFGPGSDKFQISFWRLNMSCSVFKIRSETCRTEADVFAFQTHVTDWVYEQEVLLPYLRWANESVGYSGDVHMMYEWICKCTEMCTPYALHWIKNSIISC